MLTAEPTPTTEAATLGDVTSAEWDRLARRRIFFGHQSVGDNLMEGVARVVAADQRIRLRVEKRDQADFTDGPALVHTLIGRNYEPESKSAAFLDALAGAEVPDVALYKFCYVDIGPKTDPDTLFAEYARTVDRAQSLHPELTIVHVTVPLMTARPATGLKGFARRLLGRGPSPEIENNVKRNRYNALLRARYAGSAPVFDLARIESTRPDGSRSYFLRGADTIYTLAPELTTDGGHLNELGQRRAAERFLALLARL
ncbi:MAG TPA: SGNH/GDSL hydrolase family protein [Gemmatimonadaceae bacterium]|nr:SGNH/GDSL hydrolase family protein [Gemmatimonadaceae bacterium]